MTQSSWSQNDAAQGDAILHHDSSNISWTLMVMRKMGEKSKSSTESMRVPGILGALFLILCVSCGTIDSRFPSPSHETTDCPLTRSSDGQIENESLKVLLWPEGIVVFEPGGPGFIDENGSLGMKWPWIKKEVGDLVVSGHRLDDTAPPAESFMSDSYAYVGFMPSYLVFPTPGCWEITGTLNESKLVFVVLVEKVGEGPSWIFSPSE